MYGSENDGHGSQDFLKINAHGAPDPTFNGGGLARIDTLDAYGYYPYAEIAPPTVTADGSLLYHDVGTPGTFRTLHANGTVTTTRTLQLPIAVGWWDGVVSSVNASDGGTVVLYRSNPNNDYQHFTAKLVKFNAAGQLDGSFGTNGTFTTSIDLGSEAVARSRPRPTERFSSPLHRTGTRPR